MVMREPGEDVAGFPELLARLELIAGVSGYLREPLRFSFHHVWNYVFILLAVGGLALWRFEGIDGRLGFGAVAAWVVLGRHLCRG